MWFKKIFGRAVDMGSYDMAGRKQVQEDSHLLLSRSGVHLLLVADGVGGHGNGDVASKLVIDSFARAFDENTDWKNPTDFLYRTTMIAAASLLNLTAEQPTLKNCGSTVTVALIIDNSLYWLNVGDSRLYFFGKSASKQVTKDHSLVQRLIDTGMITPAEAIHHPQRRTMTSAIGQPLNMLQIDTSSYGNLAAGDTILVCSDGVHEVLDALQLSDIIKKSGKAKQIAKQIVQKAYDAGSTDNITACVFRNG